MFGMIQALVLGLLRNGAALGAGWLVTHGVMTGDQTQGFIGSVCFLGALCFTAYDKLVVHGKIATALATPVPPAAQ